jgi:hypothetical protein
MQAIELRISGRYWDSFLYNDRLYLFTQEGEIEIYRWDRLVQSIPVGNDCGPLFWQFLARGKAWYMPEMQAILRSPKIYQEIKNLRDAICAEPYYISQEDLQNALIEVAPSPAHPHTDVEAFYGNLYLSSTQGVHVAPLNQSLESSFDRSTDIPAFRMACSYGAMAIAAGSDGVFEQTLTREYILEESYEPVQLSDRACAACSWASFDVVATSGAGSAGYVAAFSKPSRDEEESRQLIGVVDSTDLFPSSGGGLLIGSGNLIALASQSSIILDGWSPYRRRDDHGIDLVKSLSSRETVEVEQLTDDAIDGAVTVYGLVFEMDESLLVVGVDGSRDVYPEPINWRTFPRSQRYMNHLHMTCDQGVRIIAYIEDYFLNSRKRGPAMRRPREPVTRTPY